MEVVEKNNCSFSDRQTWPFQFYSLVPDAWRSIYNERPDRQVSLQIKLAEATLQFNCGFLFFDTLGTNGLKKWFHP